MLITAFLFSSGIRGIPVIRCKKIEDRINFRLQGDATTDVLENDNLENRMQSSSIARYPPDLVKIPRRRRSERIRRIQTPDLLDMSPPADSDEDDAIRSSDGDDDEDQRPLLPSEITSSLGFEHNAASSSTFNDRMAAKQRLMDKAFDLHGLNNLSPTELAIRVRSLEIAEMSHMYVVQLAMGKVRRDYDSEFK